MNIRKFRLGAIALFFTLAILEDFFYYFPFYYFVSEVIMPLLLLFFILSFFIGSRNTVRKTTTANYNNVKTTTKRRYSAKETKAQQKLKEYFEVNEQMVLSEEVVLKKVDNDSDMMKNVAFFYNNFEVCTLYDITTSDLTSYNKVVDYLNDNDYFEKEIKVEEKAKMAEYYIEKVNEYNVEIEHQEISNSLYITSSLLTTLKNLEEKGLKMDDDRIRKTYQYYLPMLLEILENYRQMKGNYYLESDIKQQEEKLINIINLTNDALKNTLSSINQEDIVNMNINMSTLEAILKGDGVISDLDKIKEKVR